MSRKKVVFRQMRTGEYWQDDRGGVWIDERLLRKRPRRPKRERVPDLDEDDDGEVEADADDVPEAEQESVDPSDWQFDDETQDVTIGGRVLHFQGGTQYKLLKYAAQGGHDLQEAWEKVWGFHSAFLWRTIWDTARVINRKLTSGKVVGKLTVKAKKILFQIPENTD